MRDSEKRIAAARKHRVDNAERIRAARRAAYAADPARFQAAKRQSYERHREARIAAAVEYQRQNPHITATTRNKRRAKASAAVTGRDLLRLLARHRGCCAYCGTALGAPGKTESNALQWDHVIPLSRGGWHSIGNLLPSCRTCNASKSAKLLTEWRYESAHIEAVAA